MIRHHKMERSLVSQYVVRSQIETECQPFQVVKDRLVGAHNAFGHTGGAAGKKDIKGIRGHDTGPQGGQKGLVGRTCGQILHKKDRTVPADLPGSGLHRSGSQDSRRFQDRKDPVHPRFWHSHIHRTVAAAAVGNAQKRNGHQDAFFHENSHRTAWALQSSDPGPNGGGQAADLRKLHGTRFILIGRPLGKAGSGFLQKRRYIPPGSSFHVILPERGRIQWHPPLRWSYKRRADSSPGYSGASRSPLYSPYHRL